MKLEGLAAWIALRMVPGIGSVTLRRLVEQFGSAEAVWDAGSAELSETVQLTSKVRDGLVRRPDEQAVKRSIDILEKIGAWNLTFLDDDYPRLLNETPNPPALIIGIGDRACLNMKSIAIVGSRGASAYGLKVARDLSSGLVRNGFTVVSGLALGIDTASHEAALDSGGTTIGVLGCGIDVSYPRQNAGLARRMAGQGAVITEFLPGTAPESKNFPIRNRIISGFSRGVVVVEASMKSGSLITASCALDQGREVMAVPGSIYSYKSGGTHWLIKQGAKLVENVADIIEEVGTVRQGIIPDMVKPSVYRTQPGLFSPGDQTEISPEEQHVFDKLEAYPQHIDDIAHRCGKSISRISGLLVQMELKDLVQALPGQTYQLK